MTTMIIAYGAIWLILMAFVLRLFVLTGRLKGEMDQLKVSIHEALTRDSGGTERGF